MDVTTHGSEELMLQKLREAGVEFGDPVPDEPKPNPKPNPLRLTLS